MADDNHTAGYQYNSTVYWQLNKCIDLSLLIDYSTYFQGRNPILGVRYKGKHIKTLISEPGLVSA